MSLDSDPLHAAPAARQMARSRGRWRVAAFVVAALAIVVLAGRFGFSNGQVGDHIARLRVDGVINTDPARLRELQAIADDDSVKAVIVAINSPGGTTAGGEELYQALEAIRKTKPVVAVIAELGASAAYMTAIASDRIFARNLSIVGSIGVFFAHVDAGKLMQTIGIDYDKVQTGPLKAEPDIDDPLAGQVRESLQALVDDSYDWFVDVVADARQMDRSSVLALADGRIVTGRQGVANGLIDAVGGELEAISWLQENKGIAENLPVFTQYPPPKTPLEDLMHFAGGKALAFAGFGTDGANALDGLVSLWHAGQLQSQLPG